MGKRAYDNGSLYSGSFGAQEIADFRRTWPASGLNRLRSVWAQFEKRDGSLVDLECNGGSCERFDGSALSALAKDIQCWAAGKLKLDLPEGCGGLGNTDEHSRYGITHLDENGDRILTLPAQARYLFATAREADRHMESMLSANREEDLADIYGRQAIGTFKVQRVPRAKTNK